MARRAIHQVDGVLTIVDARIFVTTGEFELEARNRLIGRFQFRAFHGRIEIAD